MAKREITGNGACWLKDKNVPDVYVIQFSVSKGPKKDDYRHSRRRVVRLNPKDTKRTKEAQLRKAMEQFRLEIEKELSMPEELLANSKDGKTTVGKYAREFHVLREGTMRSPLSYKREGTEIDHIEEMLGEIPLKELESIQIKRAFAKARKEGRFSERELQKTFIRLKRVLKEAIRDGFIEFNPCDRMDAPKPAPAKREALTAQEASRFLRCLMKRDVDSHIVASRLLLETGMRRAEALGCTWGSIDMDAGVLRISGQYGADLTFRAAKSMAGHRALHLSDEMMAFLRDWKAKQYVELLKGGIEQGKDTPLAHALTPVIEEDEHGKMKVTEYTIGFMNPNNYSRWFRDFCVDEGFGKYTKNVRVHNFMGRVVVRGSGYVGITPHMLRHTQATLLIGAGADMKTVQNRLGHSNVSLTLSTYSHVIPANDKAAAETFSSMLKSG